MADSIDNCNVEQETGLNYEQRWQIIQHFTEWIKHGDSKIQMLLTVQGVIVAAYVAFIPQSLSKQNAWNYLTIFSSAIFAFLVLWSFLYGLFGALQPYTKSYEEESKKINVFFYGSYNKDEKLSDLEALDYQQKLNQLSEQISMLGWIAGEKFRKVRILQYLVMGSVFMLGLVFILFSL
ncbi:hypothetical protein [Rothia mucilaginosa]|uniref:hypothetical protein n=1 Tax=Rothia mucilaginosa TaxID=43675 RepID=UPI002889B678|nr:hypothetical protein [Rothia mucilaginosa]